MSATAQDVLAVVRTAVAAGGLANKVTQGLIDGRVKVMHDYYVADASEALASTIKFGKNLPAGAKVLAILLTSSVAQSSVTISVGDGASAARYVTAGSTTLQTALAPLLALGLGYIIGTTTSDNYILVTTAGATLTAGTIYCTILYTSD